MFFNAVFIFFLKVAEITPSAAEEAFMRLLSDTDRTDEVAIKLRENCVYRLAKLYVTERQFAKVLSLLEAANPLFAGIAKVLTAHNEIILCRQLIFRSFPFA